MSAAKPMPAICLGWKPLKRNTLLGFAKIQVGALVINDVPDVEHIQREVNRLHEEDDDRRRRSLGGSGILPDDGT